MSGLQSYSFNPQVSINGGRKGIKLFTEPNRSESPGCSGNLNRPASKAVRVKQKELSGSNADSLYSFGPAKIAG